VSILSTFSHQIAPTIDDPGNHQNGPLDHFGTPFLTIGAVAPKIEKRRNPGFFRASNTAYIYRPLEGRLITDVP